MKKAGLENPALPLHMQDLFDRPERYDVLDNDISAVTEYMRKQLC